MKYSSILSFCFVAVAIITVVTGCVTPKPHVYNDEIVIEASCPG